MKLKGFNYNDNEGPFGKAFDLFGDESIKMINIPGHSDGLCAVKIKNSEGKYVLLFSDGGYGEKSWREMITSGISMDKGKQKKIACLDKRAKLRQKLHRKPCKPRYKY